MPDATGILLGAVFGLYAANLLQWISLWTKISHLEERSKSDRAEISSVKDRVEGLEDRERTALGRRGSG